MSPSPINFSCFELLRVQPSGLSLIVHERQGIRCAHLDKSVEFAQNCRSLGLPDVYCVSYYGISHWGQFNKALHL